MSAESYANQEFADEAHDDLRKKNAERREQVAEHESTRQWLETQIESDTRMVAVNGREFEFTTLGTDTIADVAELAPDDADDDELALGEVPALLRACCDTLAEHCLDPVMDREAWGKLDPDVVEDTFSELAGSVGGEDELDAEDRERADGFRQK